jgi:AcrR family transcriptional regulator
LKESEKGKIMPMPNSETGLREQILSNAQSLFIQHGYHGLAMREISEAVGVTKAALYYHFKDKEELFMAILKAYLDEVEVAIDGILAQPVTCREQISLFVRYILEQPAEKRAITRLASQEIGQVSVEARKSFDQLYREKFIDKLKSILQNGMERGEFRSIRPEVATWSLMGMMYPYFYPSQTGNAPLSAETIREIISIYIDGISQAN